MPTFDTELTEGEGAILSEVTDAHWLTMHGCHFNTLQNGSA